MTRPRTRQHPPGHHNMAQDYSGATTRMGMGQAQQHEPVHATTPPRTRRHGPGLDDTAQDATTRPRTTRHVLEGGGVTTRMGMGRCAYPQQKRFVFKIVETVFTLTRPPFPSCNRNLPLVTVPAATTPSNSPDTLKANPLAF